MFQALSTLTAPPSPGGGASSIPNLAASLPIGESFILNGTARA